MKSKHGPKTEQRRQQVWAMISTRSAISSSIFSLRTRSGSWPEAYDLLGADRLEEGSLPHDLYCVTMKKGPVADVTYRNGFFYSQPSHSATDFVKR